MKYVGILFLVHLAIGVSLGQAKCMPNGCGEGDWTNGKCSDKSLIYHWCNEKLCEPQGPCTCCVEMCRNVGCEAEGGKCYPKKQANMQCVQSTTLCRGMPKPGTPFTMPCWCCKNEVPPSDDCEDKGCAKLWNGQGQCVKVTKEPWAEIMDRYDLRYTNPWNNKKCADPSGGDKDCCLCMKKRTDCKDEGCFEKGGMCVDLKNSYLGNQNSFPISAVDLGAKIEGDLCRGEGTSANSSKKCCECYRRK